MVSVHPKEKKSAVGDYLLLLDWVTTTAFVFPHLLYSSFDIPIHRWGGSNSGGLVTCPRLQSKYGSRTSNLDLWTPKSLHILPEHAASEINKLAADPRLPSYSVLGQLLRFLGCFHLSAKDSSKHNMGQLLYEMTEPCKTPSSWSALSEHPFSLFLLKNQGLWGELSYHLLSVMSWSKQPSVLYFISSCHWTLSHILQSYTVKWPIEQWSIVITVWPMNQSQIGFANKVCLTLGKLPTFLGLSFLVC
jgi:hypothetical protein